MQTIDCFLVKLLHGTVDRHVVRLPIPTSWMTPKTKRLVFFKEISRSCLAKITGHYVWQLASATLS